MRVMLWYHPPRISNTWPNCNTWNHQVNSPTISSILTAKIPYLLGGRKLDTQTESSRYMSTRYFIYTVYLAVFLFPSWKLRSSFVKLHRLQCCWSFRRCLESAPHHTCHLEIAWPGWTTSRGSRPHVAAWGGIDGKWWDLNHLKWLSRWRFQPMWKNILVENKDIFETITYWWSYI